MVLYCWFLLVAVLVHMFAELGGALGSSHDVSALEAWRNLRGVVDGTDLWRDFSHRWPGNWFGPEDR